MSGQASTGTGLLQAPPSGSRVMAPLNRLGALTTGIVVCFWFFTAFRAVPVPVGDYGMFVTVAERLKAGDRLYVDVYENKDPFFHYMLALGRTFTPFAGWILELLWLLAASIAVFTIARRSGIAFRTSVIVGFVAVPAMMTGYTYWAGVSHIPGVALALLCMALAMRERALLSGIAVGSLLFLKFVVFPIGILFVAVAFVVPRRFRALVRASVAAVLTILGAVLLMLLRGEFFAYLAALRDNAVYASSMETTSGFEAAIEHLHKVLVPNNFLILVTAVILILATVVRTPGVLRPSLDPIGTTLLWSGVGALVVALAALSQTGLWIHHAQILLPGAAVALVLFMARGPAYCRGSSALAILTGVALAIPLSGIPSPRAYITPVEYARAIIWEQTQIPPAAQLILQTGPPTTFARIGGGNDEGFGRGLGDWRLACPLFGQSTLTTPVLLDQTLECLPEANVVFIDNDATGGASDSPWDTFIRGVNSLMDADYRCESESVGRICVRNHRAT